MEKLSDVNQNTKELSANTTDENLKLVKVRKLDLTRCQNIEGWGLFYLRNITHLNVSGCNAIANVGLTFVSKLPLHTLNINGCETITNEELNALIGLPLNTLKMSNCNSVTHLESLKKLPLTYLDISCCENIRDCALTSISNMSLRILYIGFNQITDRGLGYLNKLPLNKLSLCFCEEITNQGLNFLPINLQFLDIDYCTKINKLEFKRTRPKIRLCPIYKN